MEKTHETRDDVLYLLASAWDGGCPIAVYSDKRRAEADGREEEARWKRSAPIFKDWSDRRWAIVVAWKAAGKIPNGTFSQPSKEQELEIEQELGGPRPALEGYESCHIIEILDHISLGRRGGA